MKIVALIMLNVLFAVFKILYANTTEEIPDITIPSIDTPNIDFIDVSGGCSGFTDCIEYVGAVLYNIGAGIIFVILFIIELLLYLFEIFALILQTSFSGIEGAPELVNLILVLPITLSIAFILYKLIRKGSSQA